MGKGDEPNNEDDNEKGDKPNDEEEATMMRIETVKKAMNPMERWGNNLVEKKT